MNLWVDYIKNKSDKWFEKIEQNLENHQFFSEMEHHITIRIPNLPIEHKFKKKVFRDILILKYTHFKEWLYKFVQRKDIDIMTENELYKEFKKTFDDIVTWCIKEANDIWIPPLVMEKFMYWHNGTIESTARMIKEFCFSTYFYTNTARLSAILSAYNVEFYLTLVDAEKALQHINWDLIWLNYKWMICEWH